MTNDKLVQTDIQLKVETAGKMTENICIYDFMKEYLTKNAFARILIS